MACGKIETKDQGKRKKQKLLYLSCNVVCCKRLAYCFSNSQLLMSFLSSGVVSVSFEEDEDGNLCLIAYPLNGDHDNLENLDNSDCEPKSKLLRWTNKKTVLLENEKIPKEWVRQHRKEEKMKR